MVSSRVRPMGVSAYSTRGGMTGWMVLVTMPSRSSPRSVTVSILAVMPLTPRCSSVNRIVPCPSRSMTYTDHLSPTRWSTSRARQLAGSPAGPGSPFPAGSHAPSGGSRSGPAGPDSTTSPPWYHTRLLPLSCDVLVLDASTIYTYYKELTHASKV